MKFLFFLLTPLLVIAQSSEVKVTNKTIGSNSYGETSTYEVNVKGQNSNKSLIDGAAKAAPKFTDVLGSFQKGFNANLYSSGATPIPQLPQDVHTYYYDSKRVVDELLNKKYTKVYLDIRKKSDIKMWSKIIPQVYGNLQIILPQKNVKPLIDNSTLIFGYEWNKNAPNSASRPNIYETYSLSNSNGLILSTTFLNYWGGIYPGISSKQKFFKEYAKKFISNNIVNDYVPLTLKPKSETIFYSEALDDSLNYNKVIVYIENLETKESIINYLNDSKVFETAEVNPENPTITPSTLILNYDITKNFVPELGVYSIEELLAYSNKSGILIENKFTDFFQENWNDIIFKNWRKKYEMAEANINLNITDKANNEEIKNNAIDELKKLKELLDLGLLTQEEFDSKANELKKIILK